MSILVEDGHVCVREAIMIVCMCVSVCVLV